MAGYNDEGKGMDNPMKGIIMTFVWIMVGITIISAGFQMLIEATNGGYYRTFCEGFNGEIHYNQDKEYSCDILSSNGEITRMRVLCVDMNCQLKEDVKNIRLH